jgi:hypothetical protein
MLFYAAAECCKCNDFGWQMMFNKSLFYLLLINLRNYYLLPK